MFTLEGDRRKACRLSREPDAELDYYIRVFSLTVDLELVLIFRSCQKGYRLAVIKGCFG